MGKERRMFEREEVQISFVYSLDEGESLADGTWHEGLTEDIGPVLVGGMAFVSDKEIPLNTPIRIALFMDLNLREVWLKEKDNFPTVYRGHVCRVNDKNGKYRIAITFQGFELDYDQVELGEEKDLN